MGAIRESDRKRVCFFIKKGNADIFLEQLQQFNELIKQEWVNKGNCSEGFQSHGPRIILILDNVAARCRSDLTSERVTQRLS
jgi:transposase